MGIKEVATQKLNNAKGKIKKVLIKKVLIPVIAVLLFIVIVVGGFLVVIEKIKDTAGSVVDTVGSVFSKTFDNKSDNPIVKIDDKLIDEIKKEIQKDAIDLEATYLTDLLLKKSLAAYYATQYPYIEGINYTDDEVKGCIYLKRSDSNKYMKYINYDSFKGKLGDNKTANNVDDIKKYFSVDDEDNIVVATWSRTSEVTENVENNYQQDGSLIGGYSITEYKIDHKTMTSQYAMSYKLPILLANLYSNEGFGIAVADLAINSKIELTIFDDTVETTTITKEYFKMNYKASGTYSWRHFENDPLTTESFQDFTWVNDYTTEQNVYEIKTQITEENNITIKPTLLDTWVIKGEVTDINKETSSTDSSNQTTLENDPKDYTVDPNTSITEDQKKAIIQQILQSRSDIIENSIESVNATVYKQMTDHSMTTLVNNKEVSYTSSDMELVDNTDKFLALIRANSKGKFDKNGKLVEYIKRGNNNNQSLSHIFGSFDYDNEDKDDIESEFLSSIDMLIEILENDKDISDYANIMKYIYYKYTEDDDYKTELDFSAYNTNEMNDVESSYASGSLATEFLKAWENGAIRDYVNGTSKWSTYVSKFITKDKKYYICYHDYNDDRGDRNYAYGVCHTPNVNSGTWWHTEAYKNKKVGGISINITEAKYNNPGTSKIEVEKVDAVFDAEVKSKRNYVKTKLKEAGINDLEDYQIEALTTIAYQYGNIGNFCEMYKKYGNTTKLRDNATAQQGNHYFTTGRGETNGRPQAVWNFFHNGKCTNSRGEEIKASSVDAAVSTEVEKILKYKDAQAYQLVCGKSSLPTSSQFSRSQADKMMKTIEVPIRVWTGKGLNTKISKKKLTINKNLVGLWTAFFTDLSNIEDFVIDPNTLYGYCYRTRTSGSTLSSHALGAAVDINPNIQGNGYGAHVMTKKERDALGKNNKVKYQTLYKGSPMQKLAEKYTLSWGGAWNSSTDAMHFSYVGDGKR